MSETPISNADKLICIQIKKLIQSLDYHHVSSEICSITVDHIVSLRACLPDYDAPNPPEVA